MPCITLRDETAWVDTVQAGWNTLAGAGTHRIVDSIQSFAPPGDQPPLYGDGRAAPRIVKLLEA